jgi:hypothetical protein
MATEAQQKANQANAQHSTGPRTAEGKLKSAFNARRHNLTGQFYAMSPADELAFHTFEVNLKAELKPVGEEESRYFIEMVQNMWALGRAAAIEQNILAIGHEENYETTNAPNWEMHAALTQTVTWMQDDRAFTNIALYQTRIRRNMERARRDLKAAQAERLAREAQLLLEAELLLKHAHMLNEALDVTALSPEIGFVFSDPAYRRKLNHTLTLQEAQFYAQHNWNRAKPYPAAGLKLPNVQQIPT